jgi:hypothetical protein
MIGRSGCLTLTQPQRTRVSGIVGCGKTTVLRRVQEALSQDKEILAGTKADPAGLQREGLGGASQREAARDQILPERPTCPGPDPGVAE